jgi:hypothetical protein
MKRVQREVPLPAEMQGRWVEDGNVSSELIVMGGEISCFGSTVEYDYKDVEQVDGALTVSLGINDKTKQDSFERANITGLVICSDRDLI